MQKRYAIAEKKNSKQPNEKPIWIIRNIRTVENKLKEFERTNEWMNERMNKRTQMVKTVDR